MKARQLRGETYGGDLEDLWYDFFQGGTLQMRAMAANLSGCQLGPGTSYFLLGGRDSVIRGLRNKGDEKLSTSDGGNFAISFKINIKRKSETAKQIAKQFKFFALTPIMMVGAPILMKIKGRSSGVSGDVGAVSSRMTTVMNAQDELISYNAKTCVIVQIFNKNTGGVNVPGQDNSLISNEITFRTLATLLDHLMPKNA